MIENQAYEHDDFIHHETQRCSNKIKNTMITNLKKDIIQTCNFYSRFHNDDYNQSTTNYMQYAQQNYRFYYYSPLFNSCEKKKNSKTVKVLHINKLNCNELFTYNSFKSCSDLYIQNYNYNNSSIDHKINFSLLHLNTNNFQSTFNCILSLVMNDEELLNTYANTVFKHAILNQSLSFLYSVLSENIASVMKTTKYGNKLQKLLERKCFESFDIPNEITDKWHLTILHGIVIFTGNLVRVSMIHPAKLNNWKEKLLENSSSESLVLLINLLYAAGTSLTQDDIFINNLASKVLESNDSSLIETYNLFMQMTDTNIKYKEQISSNENHLPLFSRSDSVPLKLSSMASKMTMDQMINQYIHNPSLSAFSKLLDDNNFSKNSIRTATELLRSIVKQTNENLHDLLDLLCDMNIYEYFNENQIKIAFSHVINENKNDEKIGEIMVLIYCRLLTEEIASFNDFEKLFAPMKKNWYVIIPFFFCKIDDQLGSWVEEMLDVDFWRNLKFIESNSIIKKMETLEKWKVIDIFPDYDTIYDYYKNIKYNYNNKSADFILDEAEISFDTQRLSEILFELLLSLNDSQMKAEGAKLKKYFSFIPSEISIMAHNCGEKGLKLISLLQ